MYDILVIIPTANKRPEYLQEAISSVLNQEKIEGVHVGFVVAPNEGNLWGTLNKMISAFHPKYYVVLSDDDRLAQKFLASTYETAQRVGGVVSTAIQNFGENDKYIMPSSFPHITSLIPTKDWLRAGRYSENGGADEDMKFGMRLLDSGAEWTVLTSALVQYRMHGGQWTKELQNN